MRGGRGGVAFLGPARLTIFSSVSNADPFFTALGVPALGVPGWRLGVPGWRADDPLRLGVPGMLLMREVAFARLAMVWGGAGGVADGSEDSNVQDPGS